MKKYKTLRNFIWYNLKHNLDSKVPDYLHRKNKQLKEGKVLIDKWDFLPEYGTIQSVNNIILVKDRYGTGIDTFGHPFQLKNSVKINSLVSINEIIYEIKFYCDCGCPIGTCLDLEKHSGFLGLDPI